jgi:hypothetical protein
MRNPFSRIIKNLIGTFFTGTCLQAVLTMISISNSNLGVKYFFGILCKG